MDYTKQIAKYNKIIKKHFADFVSMPVFVELYRDAPPQYFAEFLQGDDDEALVSSRADDLHSWHFAHYANAVYSRGEYAWKEFALAARYGHARIKFEEAFAAANKGGSVLVWEAAFYFALSTLAGWKQEASSIGLAIYRGLDTSLLDLRHTDQHEKGTLYRHFWFLLQLFCSARQLPLDTSLYSHPEDMSPYQAVLSDWGSTDERKVQAWVSALCDFHLAQARDSRHDEVLEFDTEDRMLFPYEILCWLRLREWAGVANPAEFDHPLMQQPMARMPSPMPLPQPETPLLDAVIAKFKPEYPGSFEA